MTRGSSAIEALVAVTVSLVALGAVAVTAPSAVTALRLARDGATALALAGERLELLRAGPRADGTDTTVSGGTTFARSWSVDDGRGQPDALAVEVRWGDRRVALATGAPR